MEEAEPKAGLATVPILLVGLFALLVYWGMVYLDNHGGGFNARVYAPYDNFALVELRQPHSDAEDMARKGKLMFHTYCSVCHQDTGLGTPGQFPPLAGSEWVNAKSPNRILRGVLNGLQGPIQVEGKPFNNTMVPWKGTITNDADIAMILTFVRGNKEWGNSAPPVTPDQVKAIRDKVQKRDAPFTPDELLKIPEGE